MYGDEVGGAIVPEDEGDLLLKLAREALDKADIPDLQSLFAENCRVERPTIPAVTGPTSTVIDIPNAKAEPAFSLLPQRPWRQLDEIRARHSLNSGRKKKSIRRSDVPIRPAGLMPLLPLLQRATAATFL